MAPATGNSGTGAGSEQWPVLARHWPLAGSPMPLVHYWPDFPVKCLSRKAKARTYYLNFLSALTGLFAKFKLTQWRPIVD